MASICSKMTDHSRWGEKQSRQHTVSDREWQRRTDGKNYSEEDKEISD